MNAPKSDALSAYFLAETSDVLETHTLSAIVDNEPGVLARVIGLFSGRGYNIDSLSVSETEHEKHVSRITIVTTGPRRSSNRSVTSLTVLFRSTSCVI